MCERQKTGLIYFSAAGSSDLPPGDSADQDVCSGKGARTLLRLAVPISALAMGQKYPSPIPQEPAGPTCSWCCGPQEGCTSPSSAADSSDPLPRLAVQRFKWIYGERRGKWLMHWWDGVAGRQGLPIDAWHTWGCVCPLMNVRAPQWGGKLFSPEQIPLRWAEEIYPGLLFFSRNKITSSAIKEGSMWKWANSPLRCPRRGQTLHFNLRGCALGPTCCCLTFQTIKNQLKSQDLASSLGDSEWETG